MHREDGPTRLRRALAGEAVEPVVAGLSFVPPSALPGLRGDSAVPPALALARTCAEARLDFSFVPSWEPWAPAAMAALQESGIASVWVVPGVLWPALERVGVDEGLRATVLDPGSLLPSLDAASATAAAALATGIELGADVVAVADDLAGSGGPIVSPDFALEHVLSRLARIAQVARRAGRAVILHSDGDMRVFLPHMSASGFGALHGDFGGEGGLERLYPAAREAGVTLVGGLPTTALESLRTAMLAGAEAGVVAREGGLVLADDGGITTGEQVAGLLGAVGVARR